MQNFIKQLTLYRHKHILARVALAVALVGITCLALIPDSSASLPSSGNDKLNHFLAFFVLALLVDRSFPTPTFNYNKIFILVGYGLMIEIIQFFIPSRSFSLYDLLADTVGIFAYVMSRQLMLFIITSHGPRKKQRYFKLKET